MDRFNEYTTAKSYTKVNKKASPEINTASEVIKSAEINTTAELKLIPEIKTVAIIGLGALGIMFGNLISEAIPKVNLRFIADQNRITRYEAEKVYCNGEQCDFHYMTPEEKSDPADLVLFTVKYQGLKDAVKAVQNQVGEHTIIMSALNGITSETIIGETYGMGRILYCVAQGMDAVKVENRLTYDHMGMLVFGDKEAACVSPKVKAVSAFFDKVKLPYQTDENMMKRLWGKFMLNVGVNQTVAVYGGTYGTILEEGEPRAVMIAAMKEVLAISEKEGIYLTEEDLSYWLKVLGTLSPQGKPSMRQDLEAERYSEVDLFAGTVLDVAKKHGITTPVNQMLYYQIKLMESRLV